MIKRVYLGGAVTEATDPVSWRASFMAIISPGWEYGGPFLLEQNLSSASLENIVLGDLSCIRRCDAFVARFDLPSSGTAMELFYAHNLRIPTCGIALRDTKLSGWIKYHCNTMVHSITGAREFLERIK